MIVAEGLKRAGPRPTRKKLIAALESMSDYDVGLGPDFHVHYGPGDHIAFDKSRENRDFFIRRGLVECDWGYAITCHKAQGSGFENVVVVDDGFGHWDRRLRAKWQYTAITRAADTLTILA